MLKPNVSHCIQENEVHYNPFSWNDEYLTFVALEDGTFQLSTNAVSYSIDNGKTWSVLAADTATPTVTAGNKIMWKGELTPTSNEGVGTFSSTGQFDVKGNVMSLLYGSNFKGQEDLTGKDYAFLELFSANTKVVNAENLILPATTLGRDCYNSMFRKCTSLTTVPELPATTLAIYCYCDMFYDCTSLTTAPQLPATTLANACYSNMFNSCSSLTRTPELPVTTLANSCYAGMFRNCTSLTTAPELPATTLADNCYRDMFRNCTNLNSITCLATNISATNCTNYWVNGVAANGTFTKAANMTSWPTGTSGIPTNWTVRDAS